VAQANWLGPKVGSHLLQKSLCHDDSTISTVIIIISNYSKQYKLTVTSGN